MRIFDGDPIAEEGDTIVIAAIVAVMLGLFLIVMALL